jgi:hypothetical protein
LLDRFDEVVPFRDLGEADFGRIADLMLDASTARLHKQRKIKVRVTDEARKALYTRGYDPAEGARPLRRVIQKQIETPLSYRLVGGSFPKGSTVVVGFHQGEFTFEAERPKREGRRSASKGSATRLPNTPARRGARLGPASGGPKSDARPRARGAGGRSAQKGGRK